MRIREYSQGFLPPDSYDLPIPQPSRKRVEPVPPEGEAAALLALGFSKPLISILRERSEHNGTTLEEELLSDGWVSEEAYYGAIARFLRLPFLPKLDPAGIRDLAGLDSQLCRPRLLRLEHAMRAPEKVMVPEASKLFEFAARLKAQPGLRRDLVITSRTALIKGVWEAGGLRRAQAVVSRLFEESPGMSARIVLSGQQGFWCGVVLASFVSAFVLFPTHTLLGLHLSFTLLYFLLFLLRLGMFALHFRLKAPKEMPPPAGPVPVYTVMVAVYREAAVAEQLVGVLKRLDWPASRLDIKLVCEADDRETIDALAAQSLGPQFEIVEVPDFGPRTKPKALSYALAGARGEFLAIYDAEDRPHPQQLREAYAHFCRADDRLACLQSPLIIGNAGQSSISALFAMEYAGLFRATLPVLARFRMPLPLGGTSNHFRTHILRQAGGWDPFNVTEDADLGMRLYRLGYRTETLKRQTVEDAPTDWKVWTGQRTRWYKGWLQTWLVMMRNPRKLIGDMGIAAFSVFHLTIGGMLLSALIHPTILLFVAAGAVQAAEGWGEMPTHALVLFVMDCINIVGSYLVFLGLGYFPMIRHERQLLGWRWAGVPMYWMRASYAAWRAMLELRSKPFFWNKTPHLPTVRKVV
jgi:cellulose synthase/poly-beta-1,6-N-acetylglucosamine synthase-like glycosyltransferase